MRYEKFLGTFQTSLRFYFAELFDAVRLHQVASESDQNSLRERLRRASSPGGGSDQHHPLAETFDF